MTFVEQTGVNILGFILCYLFESHDIQIPDNIPTVSTEIFMIWMWESDTIKETTLIFCCFERCF